MDSLGARCLCGAKACEVFWYESVGAIRILNIHYLDSLVDEYNSGRIEASIPEIGWSVT